MSVVVVRERTCGCKALLILPFGRPEIVSHRECVKAWPEVKAWLENLAAVLHERRVRHSELNPTRNLTPRKPLKSWPPDDKDLSMLSLNNGTRTLEGHETSPKQSRLNQRA